LDAELEYFQSFKGNWRKDIQPDMQASMQYYSMLMQMVRQYEILGKGVQMQDHPFYQRFSQTMGPLSGQI
jgi:hypothetical protein